MSILGTAIFDETGQYRYTLTRSWSSLENNGIVNWIMLNPSTADEFQDDPTIRRCISFTKEWGYNGLIITNLYAFRSTDPNVLLGVEDPIGKDNITHIIDAVSQSKLTIGAWGAFKIGVPDEIYDILTQIELWCLGTTKSGCPKHPLYVKGTTKPQRLILP